MAGDRKTRREFVKDATVAAAGITAGLGTACAVRTAKQPPTDVSKTRSYNEQMEYRRLGKTGLMLSAVCLGGHWKKIPHKMGTEGFKKNRHDVMSACIDCGINYVDACMGQEILAYSEALRGRRDRMFFGFSWYEHEMRSKDWQTAKKLLQGFDDGMRKAKLDYVDLWRITCYWQPHTNHTLAHEEAICEALEKTKKAGKARFGGISTHKHDWAMRMMERYPEQIDVVVVPYTAGSKKAHLRVEPAEDGWKAAPDDAVPQDKPTASLIDAVKQHDVGWLGIKPFANGSIFRSRGEINPATKEIDDERARQTLRYVLCNDALTAPMPGMISVDQVRNAARAVTERRQFDLAETERFEQAVAEMWANLPRNYQWLREWEWV